MKKTYLNNFLNIKFLLIGLVSTFSLAVTVWAFGVYGFIGMSGYAWSDTIGWISMSCKTGGPTGNDVCASNNYGVTVSTTTGNLSGYAWSDNIGWVSFNSADVSGCPVSPCAPKLTSSGLSGFAKALAGGTAQAGGWDGYIDLSSVNRTSETLLSGYAWGSDVVGWVDMRGSATDGVALVYEPTNATLSTNPTKVSYNGTSTITWSSTKAINCTAGGNWSNLTPPVGDTLNGSGGTGVLTENQTYTFQCFGLGTPSPVRTATVITGTISNPILNKDDTTFQPYPTAITTFTGQYTPNGKIVVTGTNVDNCIIKRDGVEVDSGPSPLTVNFSTSGTYTTMCSYTDGNGVVWISRDNFSIAYKPIPPKPIVSLRASPSNISVNSQSVLTWKVTYPNSVQVPGGQPACILTAKPVCPLGTCNPSQLLASTTINNIIKNDNTDANDPNGNRKITSSAINEITPYYNLITNTGDTDWEAHGKKTFILNHSMDFMLKCGSGPNESQGVRVMVTSSNEG